MKSNAWVRLVAPFSIVYLVLQLVTRLGLLIYSGQAHDATFLNWIGMFVWGFIFDLNVLGFFLIPVVLVHLFKADWDTKGMRIARFAMLSIFTYIWLFTAVSEFFFWDEFGTRFNFIAVDYLVYTTEVIGNIQESYPLYPILAALAVATAGVVFAMRKYMRLDGVMRGQRRWVLAFIAAPVLMLFVFNVDNVNLSSSQTIQEVATNGAYDLFHAYRHNELSYKDFYVTKDEQEVAANVHRLLAKDGNTFVSKDPNDITRVVTHTGPEKHKNVVIIVMESMGGDFMGTFGNTHNWTPNLDGLAKDSLFLSNMYATGTRTVRGLEAVTLSVPPTPGQSILRRPGNENLFSLGYVFQDRGYDTAFIYGGHGYFDNMNAFFAGNGFRIHDRTDFADKDVTFSNVWGVSDEDLFNEVVRQADADYNKKQPFMFEVMTTSNHRPYTFPKNDVGIPEQNGGRAAGVKYADYAVGKLIAAAKTKPWFKDTVFVFVADHTAGAGGKIDLSPIKYHIPGIFYAPGFIQPKDYKPISSQIDIAPTLLGLLNFSYYTKFYGEDVMNEGDDVSRAHAFISNYQKVAYMMNGQLTVLEPMKKTAFYNGEAVLPEDKIDHSMLTDTVSYYQFASGWKERMKRIPTVVKK